jgi:putative transposase
MAHPSALHSCGAVVGPGFTRAGLGARTPRLLARIAAGDTGDDFVQAYLARYVAGQEEDPGATESAFTAVQCADHVRPTDPRSYRKGAQRAADLNRMFADPAIAQEVFHAMKHYHERQWIHAFAWVVMPDHVHWLLQLRVGTLQNLMRMFKTWSSSRVRKMMHEPPPRVWQPGYHDRRVREHEDLDAYSEYIIGNPVRAGLCNEPREYPYLCASSEFYDMKGKEPAYLNSALPWER